MSAGTVELTVVTARWPRVRPGADLVDLLVTHGPEPADGDIVAFTSKIVSKAEGRYWTAGHDAAVASESVRVVSRRGPLVISESRSGHVQANAGVDGSNVEPPGLLLLPTDADRTARALRAGISRRAAVNVAVVITDTMGRPWRAGHVDQAIGCAGMVPLLDLTGRSDGYGNTLQVTAPATGDEVASAADLVKGKLAGTPVAVLRGLAGLVLPRGQDGPGARALVRPATEDLFGWGAREAVLAAALRIPAELAHFGLPDPVDTVRALAAVAGSLQGVRVDLAPGQVAVRAVDRAGAFEAGRAVERVVAVLSAHRADVSVHAASDTCWHVTYTVAAAVR